jgi:hypothetical protein
MCGGAKDRPGNLYWVAANQKETTMKAKEPRRVSAQQPNSQLALGENHGPENEPPPPEPDPIDEAAAESFPASDPPNFTGSTASPSSRQETDQSNLRGRIGR